MSSLNIFQQFVNMEIVKSKLELPNPINAALDYCEYLIRIDFNLSDKNIYATKKNRKNQIPKELSASLGTLNREQKIQYYCMIVGFMEKIVKENFDPPKSSYSGMLNTVGFSRSFNIKRWKEKKLRLDMDKHLMFAEREQKIKSYDLRNYILRRSKNKEFYCFVLEAINKIPPEKSMTVHIGFREQNRFKQWLDAIQFSVMYRQWELYLNLFFGKRNTGLTKSMSAKIYTTDDLFGKTQPADIDRQNYTSSDVIRDNNMNMTSSLVIQHNRNFQDFQKPLELKIKGKSSHQNQKKEEKKLQGNKEDEELKKKIKEQAKLENEIKDYQSRKQISKTYVDELIQGDIFEEPDVFSEKIEEEENEIIIKSKRHLDLFHKLYPEYELQQLQIFANFEIKYEGPNFKIYQNTLLEKRVKMMAIFNRKDYNVEQILSMLSKPETNQVYNDNIQSCQLKTFISSENSALMYLVNKPYNRLYRSRDYVFIRHVFNNKNKVYMIDKSIQNANYPPFLTIVRGQLCNVYGIIEKKDVIELIADFQMQNGGLLNPVQEKNLTMKFLRGYQAMIKAEIGIQSYKFFRLDWDISKNKANQIEDQIRTRRKTLNFLKKDIIHDQEARNSRPEPEHRNFSKKKPHEEVVVVDSSKKQIQEVEAVESPSKNELRYAEKSVSSSPEPGNINSPPKPLPLKLEKGNSLQQVEEINGQQQKSLSYLNVVRQLNSEGLVLIDQSYMKTKYTLTPLKNTKIVLLNSSLGHPLWKNEWVHDDKDGGVIFVHKKKIEDQKGVLKFILSKIAKNLVSGQSITNISLPVDIFSAQSNLQRFLYSMSYGPLVLQGLVKENLMKKFIRTVIFGISNSLLYLSMEKPFNPILGQTFQCWINGCPAYAEQISHHPPIGALIFKGRGYEVTAQLESKVSLGMNSGTGTNEGIYKVKFQDNDQICFISPGGEVSGLTAGDRKFNLVGKSYYWITNTNFMLELVFDRYKRGFFSIGTKEKPSDFFEGSIWEVKPEFMKKFLSGKRREPDEKDRVKDFGRISGVWNKYICYNQTEIWNFDRQFPVVLEYEANPLPSDSNWREDIEYRRRNQITRAQTEKQRLQVLQRKDRKFREKLGKKK